MKGLSLGNRCQGENRTKISIFSVKSQPNRYNFDFLDTTFVHIFSFYLNLRHQNHIP